MKFILIITFLSGQPYGGSHGIAMQEFDSKSNCESAGKKAKELIAKVSATEVNDVIWICEPK